MEKVIASKICSRCENDKPLSDFYSYEKESKKKGKYIYYNPYCKACASKMAMESERKNLEKTRKRQKEYRESNKERKAELMRKFFAENKEDQREYQKRWRQNNKEKMNEHGKRYREQKKFIISKAQWKACKEYFHNCCAYCGIDGKEAKRKYGKVLNKEHALNNGANDITNCLPSCTSCNSAKWNRDYVEWYIPDNPVYNEERMSLIKSWLNEEYKKCI